MPDPMQYTITLRISGCASECWHCYVGGGPGPHMHLDRVLRSFDALERIVERLGEVAGKLDLWLDYEPLLHPDVCKILREMKSRFGGHFDARTFPTTGIPIAARPDWEDLLETLAAVGVEEIQFALHGPADLHDRALGRAGAFEAHRKALERVRNSGFGSHLKVPISEEALQRWPETLKAIGEGQYDAVRVEVPVYSPTRRMRAFESRRPTLAAAVPHLNSLSESCTLGIGKGYWLRAAEYAECNVIAEVSDRPAYAASFRSIEDGGPRWVFLSVLPDASLFYGNVGQYHRKLAVLGVDEADLVVEALAALDPNYLFGGFYDVDRLPSPWAVAESHGNPRSDRLYHTREDALMRWLDLRMPPAFAAVGPL